MSARLSALGVRFVLLDIEGTTTPIAFVHDVLFSFARARLQAWLSREVGTSAGRDVLQRLRVEYDAAVHAGEPVPSWPDGPQDPSPQPAATFADWLMARDRKSPALKLLQGLIWEEGYRAGLLHGEVFPDVPGALRRWRADGYGVAIYSSGSELAQRLLFASTDAGDLTPLFAGFFDTRMGAKVEAGSYRRIVSVLGCAARDVLFVSDVTRELAAAREAGCQVCLSLRPGNAPQPEASTFDAIQSFEELT